MLRKIFYYITHWEVWHWFAKYIVIGPAWLWFCLKARSLWFFTPSNPTISFGGFVGESKSEIYKQLPEDSYPASAYIEASAPFETVMEAMEASQLDFPVAVKPDVGMMGFMFRKVVSREQLRQYHAVMPVRYIIQKHIDYPLEISVFYFRYPGEAKGHITGFVRKESMQVTGDGSRTLRELIVDYPRARFRLTELFSKHESRLNTVIAKGDTYYLSHALNLSRGGRLISMEAEKDEQLIALFDSLSHHSGAFYYGRYDIRCQSIGDLKAGRNFSILEYNGCGAEPHHVYGNGYTFIQACRILVSHWSVLLQISQMNRKSGIAPWSFKDGLKFTRQTRAHFRRLQELDSRFEFDAARTKSLVPGPAEPHYSEPLFVAPNS